MDIGRPSQQQTYYRKVIRKDHNQISLDADMIRLLIAIDENKSLYQIADEVDMRADTLKANLKKLLQQGLIEPVKKDLPVLDRIFLQALKINLSKVIGPMSEILIEEVVSEMELTSPGIPMDQAAELITTLSHEIPDEEKRIEFKKSMMDILNKKRT
jgi:predicted transcriptional regulator